jgi:hypothetical protein
MTFQLASAAVATTTIIIKVGGNITVICYV